jgi:hypothetical protein
MVISFRQAVLPRLRHKGDDMAEVIKLIRETDFGPETIQVMAAALDEVWEKLQDSGSGLARPCYSRAMREVVAKRIFELARNGVEDREALVTSALKFVAANYEPSGQRAK